MRVVVETRLQPGRQGGVEQFAIGLAKGLAAIGGDDEEYLFVANAGADEWIREYATGPVSVINPRVTGPRGGPLQPVRDLLRIGPRPDPPNWPPPTEAYEDALTPKVDGAVPVGISDGTAEAAGADIVHFPSQIAYLTDLPTIYQPHDLQHLHYPEFFTEVDRATRDAWYPAYSRAAELVVMMTEWGRRDVIEQYGLPEEKVAVVHGASVLSAYPAPTDDEIEATAKRLSLPERFLFYPAQTWPHKNHETLLEALKGVVDRHGTAIPLVSTGSHNEGYPQAAAAVERLGLSAHVQFPGFVSPVELRALYRLATALIYPSRFEGWGLPVSEAFESGLPVLSSTATGLPEVVGDAGVLFDPEDPVRMGEEIWRVWNDEGLRADLSARGLRRAEQLSLEDSARLFREHYRRIAGPSQA